jgi:hypothetical protein
MILFFDMFRNVHRLRAIIILASGGRHILSLGFKIDRE